MTFAPLMVAVPDSGQHLVALKREDGSGILQVEIASDKAWGALGIGFNSRELGKRAVKVPTFFAALGAVRKGRMIVDADSVLILGNDKQIIGAVGISSDTSDNDEIPSIVDR